MEHPETAVRKPRIAMISGHIDISHSEFATHYHSPLGEAIAKGDMFILGDAKGTDEMALDYILERDPTAHITVYASRAHKVQGFRDRNIQVVFVKAMQKGSSGRQRHLKRDAEMTKASDYDILWVRGEEECRKLYREKYRPRISGTELNRRRRLEMSQDRKIPGHDHTGKAAHRSTESRRVYNASRNENDDPPDCLRIGSPAGKNRPSPRLGTCVSPRKGPCLGRTKTSNARRQCDFFTASHKPCPGLIASERVCSGPVKATIQSSSRRVGIRARDIGGIVRDHFPDSVYTKRDIYNARARISRENLGGYSSTAALIKLFDDKEIPYVAEWAKDEPDRLVGLVWTFPYCIRMWRRFPEVVSFDNTYNTNRFKLPLFQVTGQTCLGTVFNAAFVLIDNERLEGFQFLTNGMKKALGLEFQDAQQQLCIHHINSNVILQFKWKWVYTMRDSSTGEESSSDEPDAALNQRDRQAVQASGRQEEPITRDNLSRLITHDYHGVLMLWRLVVFAETEEGHEKAWECLCTQFGDQRAILAYLYEASNNNIKSYLLNGMSHLYRLVKAIQGMLEDQEREFRQACAQDEVLTAREHVGRGSEYLGELPRMVSQKALSLITREHRKALKGIPTAENPWPDAIASCNDDCTVPIELGIPCYHTIYRKLITATPPTKWDNHPWWHLREPVSEDVHRRILDLKIATNLRGRPKNNPQPIPASMAVGASGQIRSHQDSDSQPQSSLPKRHGQSPGSRNQTSPARFKGQATQAQNSSKDMQQMPYGRPYNDVKDVPVEIHPKTQKAS
ncbi:hypothetical protein ACKAV7_014678 [Fusarium commune]